MYTRMYMNTFEYESTRHELTIELFSISKLSITNVMHILKYTWIHIGLKLGLK